MMMDACEVYEAMCLRLCFHAPGFVVVVVVVVVGGGDVVIVVNNKNSNNNT